jgi:phenylpyruvate tautomerase PptA (4-oxalocrotonate tautomerase family)
MPHVIVKLWPGKSERQKQRLADAIAQDVMTILQYGEESVRTLKGHDHDFINRLWRHQRA